MPVYVCAESALAHYREAPFPASAESTIRDEVLAKDAASTLKDIKLLTLAGLGLPTPSPESPLYVLVPPDSRRPPSRSVIPMLWGGVLPRGSFRRVSADAYVSSPEFVFLQMARKLELIPLTELGMELCGTYRRFARDGETTYDQPTLTTPRKLKAFLDKAGSAHGANRARRALKHIEPNSASPFETIVYLLLCLPRRLGGYALPRPELNASIKLSKRGRQHTLRTSSAPDLYWRESKFDLECHGSIHELEKTRTEDSMRRKALERMHVEVVELTYDEVKNPELFRAAVRRVARKLGVRLRSSGEGGFAEREAHLREILLPSSARENQLWNERPTTGEDAADFEDWLDDVLPSEFDSWEVYMAGERAAEL